MFSEAQRAQLRRESGLAAARSLDLLDSPEMADKVLRATAALEDLTHALLVAGQDPLTAASAVTGLAGGAAVSTTARWAAGG